MKKEIFEVPTAEITMFAKADAVLTASTSDSIILPDHEW